MIRFALPIDFDRFRMLLETGGHDAWWRRGSDRRQAPAGSPQLERWPDGALVYVDRAGQRWQVDDRRGGERRQAGERLFVNEAGETWACPLPGAEPGEPSVLDLERQLERAQRV